MDVITVMTLDAKQKAVNAAIDVFSNAVLKLVL